MFTHKQTCYDFFSGGRKESLKFKLGKGYINATTKSPIDLPHFHYQLPRIPISYMTMELMALSQRKNKYATVNFA
jgi:hypothetical protein